MLIDIFDFIKQLQLKKLFTISQYRFIENIFFYINDLVVYKFVISVNPKMLKKAKKFIALLLTLAFVAAMISCG